MPPKSCHQFSDRYILSLRHVNVSLFSRKWQFIFTSIIDYLLQVGVLYYWNIRSSWAVEQSTQLVVLLRSIKEAVNKTGKTTSFDLWFPHPVCCCCTVVHLTVFLSLFPVMYSWQFLPWLLLLIYQAILKVFFPLSLLHGLIFQVFKLYT